MRTWNFSLEMQDKNKTFAHKTDFMNYRPTYFPITLYINGDIKGDIKK